MHAELSSENPSEIHHLEVREDNTNTDMVPMLRGCEGVELSLEAPQLRDLVVAAFILRVSLTNRFTRYTLCLLSE
jgi:hypothetical protein